MTVRIVGPIALSSDTDDTGHRNYQVTWHVQTVYTPGVKHDGPSYIRRNWPGPVVGTPYNLAPFWPESTEFDQWAFCLPTLNIASHRDVGDNEPVADWHVTQNWSTKQVNRCQLAPIENPLLEPWEITGSWVEERREATVDRFDKPLIHPSREPIKGPLTEYTYSFPTITITGNSADIDLRLISSQLNTVNGTPIWGQLNRTVKFTACNWERKTYGNCFFYWRIAFTFQIDKNGFDQDIPAEGTRRRRRQDEGTDSQVPVIQLDAIDDFVDIRDPNTGELISTPMPLNANGEIATTPEQQLIMRPQILKQSTFQLLGVPNSLYDVGPY